MTTFHNGDVIHVSKKGRVPIDNSPAVFKGAYNHFIRIEAHVNNIVWETFTISYSELLIGDTVIHEIEDEVNNCKASKKD
jgi:hypothetical protein